MTEHLYYILKSGEFEEFIKYIIGGIEYDK